ncbi:STIV orfB116 family protein [Pyrobaculum sp.]|uniref:STIV orfB116 family protein n=1 Tax=Pyrobaculum sp. TaxID=2004705 RepID=UPI003D10EE48
MSENKNKAAAEGGQAAASREAPIYIPQWKVDGSGYIAGWGTAAISREEFVREVANRGVVLLNAAVPYEGFMFIQKLDVSTAVEVLRRANDIKSFIGHEATARLLASLTGREIAYNRGMYAPKPGDVALVIRLRSRTGGDVKDVKPDDLEFLALWYL